MRRRLEKTPSLAPLLSDPDWCEDVWGDAVTQAIAETGLDNFPEWLLWSLDDALRDGWMPA